MTFVLDASVAVAWHFEDQQTDVAEDLAFRAIGDGVVVPSYWTMEAANALVKGERAGRTDEQASSAFVERLSQIPLEIDDLPHWSAFDVLLPTAREHRLRMFDAGYLALAMRRGLPLATFDRKLARAAARNGVQILGIAP